MNPTKNVPLRVAFSVEVPGTPEQVWAALATAEGISAWFLPTDVDEREGGAIVVHMGETDSPGTITGWDPPHRLEYAEPEWAALAGRDIDSVTPLVSEFLVEAQSGGTCVVQVVSSAFGTGADWEQEFMVDMEKNWRPFFEDNLRLYLTHFPGQRATPLEASADVAGAPDRVLSAMKVALGAEAVGKPVDVRGVTGEVERIGDNNLFLRLSGPVPGYLGFVAFDKGNGTTMVAVQGWLFSDDGPGFVERQQPEWKAWLEGLVTSAA